MDEPKCKVQFTYVLIPTCYIWVVKFLEKVIIETNTDFKCPLKCKRNLEAFFREKSNVRWKDPPLQNPDRRIRIRLRQRRVLAWQKTSESDSGKSKML